MVLDSKTETDEVKKRKKRKSFLDWIELCAEEEKIIGVEWEGGGGTF